MRFKHLISGGQGGKFSMEKITIKENSARDSVDNLPSRKKSVQRSTKFITSGINSSDEEIAPKSSRKVSPNVLMPTRIVKL